MNHVDRLVHDVARLRGLPEATVRLQYGVPETDHVAELVDKWKNEGYMDAVPSFVGWGLAKSEGVDYQPDGHYVTLEALARKVVELR